MMTTTCPSPELLADYALGRVSAEALEQIAAHVDHCQDCQTRMDTMDGVDDTFVAKLRQPLPPDLASPDQELESLIAQVEAIPLDSVAMAAVSEGTAGVAAPDAEPPVTLGQYMLLSQCGQGGMGTVYKALHTRLKRLVAVKLLPAQRLADPHAVARFQREMEAVGRLSHPNIVQALDANEVDGQHFLVTEFVDGVNLSQLVRSGGPLPIPDACEIVWQAALGLQHAHDHDLVHRDVKPSNLMLSSLGIVKLLDLGLARLQPELPVEADMTASGQVMGSADYMAPEQCLNARDADARADIYSLGCTLYFLLAGRPPFAGRQHDTVGKKLLAHAHEPVLPIRELRGDVPPELAAILDRMLAKSPAERYATMDEVAAALAPLAADSNLAGLMDERKNDVKIEHSRVSVQEQASSPGEPAATKGRSRPWPWIAGMGILLLAAVLCWQWADVIVFLQGAGRPAAAQAPSPPKNREADADSSDAASAAATLYLARADLPKDVQTAMLTVIRQHPSDSRWSGRIGSTMFAVVAKMLPGGNLRHRTVPAFLSLTHMLAVQELLKAKCLLDQYAARGLTDATTLQQAVVEAAGRLQVTGQTRGVAHQATVQSDFAVAYVMADENALTAHLLQPVELDKVRAAYRDVMHRQARELMKRSNWKDALLLWQHLHKQGLVSPQLYLDAARCFGKLGQNDDLVRVLAEAVDTLGPQATPQFLEEAGDIALTIETEAAGRLAERAYRAASDRLKETVIQPDGPSGRVDE